jgi:ATP-dependent DNA helicase RecQ
MYTPLQLLKKYFGYDSFRPMQEEIIAHVLNKKDVLVLMPTGGGKSVCFQIPALCLPGTCVVVSPLIALMKDQVGGLKANGVPAAYLNSSMSQTEERDVVLACQNEQIKLLYLSPEKAIQLSDTFLRSFPVSFFAIDESHCISQWGHDFRPEYAKLKILRNQFPDLPFIALTATADKTTRKDIISQLALRDPALFVSSFDRPNLRLTVKAGMKEKDKITELVQFIKERKNESGIIYCLSRAGTEDLASKLNAQGISCGFYHAGMSSEERSDVQDKFINDEVPVICATIAFGMGIDKSNVRWVIHSNLPKNLEGYYQEIGRAGRDGLASDTILYYSLKDLVLLSRFARESGQAELSLEKLRRIQQFAEARVCRRKILLSYFGEAFVSDCGNCDVCTSPPKYFEGITIAQKAISALLRLNEQVGTTMLIHVLRGSQAGELLEAGYDKIKTYGAGKDLSFDTWSHYLMQLIQLGLIEIAYGEGFTLKVTAYGRAILKQEAGVNLTQVVPAINAKEKRSAPAPEISSSDALFEELRAVRRRLAASAKLPPYVIFNDKTLREMADRRPAGKAQMLQVPGLSENKYAKYGADFLAVLMPHAKHPVVEHETDSDLLSTEKLDHYLGWLSSRNSLPFTPQVLARILLGSAKNAGPELTDAPFYGILGNHYTYKTLYPLLKKHFSESEVAQKLKPADVTEAYFSEPVFNRVTQSTRAQIQDTLLLTPIQRMDNAIYNAYVLEQRKEHPRAYEPWSEEESALFTTVISQTNDLDFISRLFLRNPGSLRSHIKKHGLLLAISNVEGV